MSTTRRLAAILAADVAGYSRLMAADEVGTPEALKSCRREAVGDPDKAREALDWFLSGPKLGSLDRTLSRLETAAAMAGVRGLTARIGTAREAGLGSSEKDHELIEEAGRSEVAAALGWPQRQLSELSDAWNQSKWTAAKTYYAICEMLRVHHQRRLRTKLLEAALFLNTGSSCPAQNVFAAGS